MILQGQVSKPPSSLAGPSANPPLALDQFAGALVSEMNARYANLVLAGLMFGVQYASGATAAASATSAGAFALYNPVNSGKNLVIIDIVTAFASLAAATTTLIAGVTVSLLASAPTAPTGGNAPQNLLAGANAAKSVAQTYTALTTVGASTVVARNIAALYFDLAAGDVGASVKDQIDGGIIIGPGGILSIVSVAGTPTIVPSITWAEIPV